MQKSALSHSSKRLSEKIPSLPTHLSTRLHHILQAHDTLFGADGDKKHEGARQRYTMQFLLRGLENSLGGKSFFMIPLDLWAEGYCCTAVPHLAQRPCESIPLSGCIATRLSPHIACESVQHTHAALCKTTAVCESSRYGVSLPQRPIRQRLRSRRANLWPTPVQRDKGRMVVAAWTT